MRWPLWALTVIAAGRLCAAPAPLLHAPLDGAMQATWALGEPLTPACSMTGPFLDGVRGQARQLGGRNTATYYLDEGFLPPEGTCSLWVKPLDWTPGASDHFVFFTSFDYAAAEGGYVRVILYKLHDGTDLTLLIQNSIGGEKASLIKAPIEFWQKGQWHHLAFTWDADRYRLYVDGAAVGDAATVALPETGRWEIMVGTPYSSWIHIGSETNAIDEFTLWSAALDAEEIKRMHDEIAPNLPPPVQPEAAATAPGRENLALRRNGAFMLASSFRDYEASYPDNLGDGDAASFWRPHGVDMPQWLEARWELPMRVNEVVLTPQQPAGIEACAVQAWQTGSQSWRPLEAEYQAADGKVTLQFDEVQTQRLRVVIERGDPAALVIGELRVYGPPQPLIARLKPYWKASYIWFPEPEEIYEPNEPRYFRQEFDVPDPGRVRSALLQLRSNDHYRAWLNGTEVATGSKVITPIEVASRLVDGRNVLAVETELHSNPGRWGWGELIYELALNYDDHSEAISSGPETLTADREQEAWLAADFTVTDWQPAAVFVSPPDGVWGEIPYYATPAGEKATLTDFRVLTPAPKPGEPLELEFALQPGGKLHDDYCFVLELGDESVMPDWNNLEIVSVPLVPASPTSEWPAGEAQRLRAEFDLPRFAPDGAVPVRVKAYGMNLGAPLEIVDGAGQPVEQLGEVEVSRPGMQVAAPELPRLDFSRGAGAMRRGDELTPPAFWALRANSYDRYQLYSETGMHVYHIQTHPLKLDDSPETLQQVQQFAEERIATVVRVDPQAQFIVMIELRPGSAWLEANPDERLVTAQGTPGPVSYCSAAYHASVERFLDGLIGYLRERPYWDRIIGYLPMSCGAPDSTLGGTEPNLFQKDRTKITVGDFNPQATEAFRDWLRGKYGDSVERLREAWHDPEITFETATPVIGELVREGAEGGIFRDPADSGLALDYFDFLSGVIGRFYSFVMQTVKQVAGPQALVGTYYGYNVAHLRGYNNPGSMFNGNNFDLYERLQDPNWDFFAGPMPYESRAAGEPFKSYHATASVLLHDKLIINEVDHRTFMAAPTSYGRLHSIRETEAVLKRDVGGSIVDGSGHWFADWSGAQGRDGVGFFTDPTILETVRATTAAAARALEQPKTGGAEIALIVHGGTMAAMDVYRSAPLYHNLVARTVWQEMSRLGAPYDTYLLEDLADSRVQDGYKLYVLLNPFLLTADQRRLMDDLKRDGKTILFLYAPGYADRHGGLSDANITALTGFDVTHGPATEIMRYQITSTDHPITRDLAMGQEHALHPFSYEVSRELHPPAFGPVFTIEDAGEAALASYPDGGTALAARDMGEWKSVYCTVPYLPAEMLRGVCRYAGVHLYCDEDVILKADNRCLVVHNGYGQTRDLTLALPGRRDVVDLCTGQPVASGVESVSLTLAEAETRILGLTPTR